MPMEQYKKNMCIYWRASLSDMSQENSRPGYILDWGIHINNVVRLLPD